MVVDGRRRRAARRWMPCGLVDAVRDAGPVGRDRQGRDVAERQVEDHLAVGAVRRERHERRRRQRRRSGRSMPARPGWTASAGWPRAARSRRSPRAAGRGPGPGARDGRGQPAAHRGRRTSGAAFRGSTTRVAGGLPRSARGSRRGGWARGVPRPRGASSRGSGSEPVVGRHAGPALRELEATPVRRRRAPHGAGPVRDAGATSRCRAGCPGCPRPPAAGGRGSGGARSRPAAPGSAGGSRARAGHGRRSCDSTRSGVGTSIT